MNQRQLSYIDGVLIDDVEDSRITVDVTLKMAWRLRRRVLRGWSYPIGGECCRCCHGYRVTSPILLRLL